MTEEWQCRHCGQWVWVRYPVHRHAIIKPISVSLNRPRHQMENPTIEYYDYERRPSESGAEAGYPVMSEWRSWGCYVA